jgi:hypothetical protein
MLAASLVAHALLLGACKRDPAAAPPVQVAPPSPSDIVREYVAAAAVRDLRRLGRVYAPPMDAVCEVQQRFTEAHLALVAAVEKRFGAADARAIDEAKYQLQVPSFGALEVKGEGIEGDRATVAADIAPGSDGAAPQPVTFGLVRSSGQWRLASVNGQPLADAEWAQSYALEWSVATEATTRALAALAGGKAKSAKDVAFIRDDALKVVTQERVAARQLGVATGSLPPGHAPLIETPRGERPENPHAPPPRSISTQPASRPGDQKQP